MSLGRVAVLVSNDLEFDQRVRKTCATLQSAGWEPVLVGRRMQREDALSIDRPYATQRMWLGIRTGPLFYVLLQWGLMRALRRLAREGCDAVWANDLDTLGPAIWAARKWGWSLAYDSHEWFTEAEGLKGKPLRKGIWLAWEKRCFRHLDKMLTVNSAIAEAHRGRYGLEVKVVPNVPEKEEPAVPIARSSLGWPEGAVVLLMQGAFMDRDRGALDAVRAMVHLSECHLALIGAGPEHAAAASVARRLGVSDRVHVHDRMPFDALRRCTAAADIGLSLDRPTVDNFRFSLPNKLFDYLHAGIPVVCSHLPVAGKMVREEEIGAVAYVPEGLKGDREIAEAISVAVAKAVRQVMANPPSREHLSSVADRYHWGAHRDALLGALQVPSRK